MNNYQRLYTMSQNLEYRIDNDKVVDTDNIVGLFNIDKGTVEYDICKSFLDTYQPLYEYKRREAPRKNQPPSYLKHIGLGALATGAFGAPLVGALLGLWVAIFRNATYDPSKPVLSHVDIQEKALYAASVANLDHLDKIGYDSIGKK